MRLDNQLNGVTENVFKTPKRALPTFSESLKGVVTENFSGGFAPRPPTSFVNGPPQTSMLDPPLFEEVLRHLSISHVYYHFMETSLVRGLSLPSFKMSTISVLKLAHKVFLFSSPFTHLPTL